MNDDDIYHVPWWRFWIPASGVVGGFIAGIVGMVAVSAIIGVVSNAWSWWAAVIGG